MPIRQFHFEHQVCFDYDGRRGLESKSFSNTKKYHKDVKKGFQSTLTYRNQWLVVDC